MKHYSGKKRIDINQKSFAFTHRYDEDKFYEEKNLNKTSIFLTKINNRLILASLFFAAIFLAISIKLIEINLFNQSENSTLIKSYTEARGNILDRNNNPLTHNIKLANILINPNKIDNKSNFMMAVTEIFPELDTNNLITRLNKSKSFYLKRNISNYYLQQVYDIGETGIEIESSYLRKYPHKELVSHILGDVDIDNAGIAGIEKSYGAKLSQNIKNNNLVSSIDIQVQHAIRDELLNGIDKYRALGASSILMDINTGEIISMVSLPDYDPNKSYNSSDLKLFNKNTEGIYEFGSVMKTFTVAIGLEENKFDLNSKFPVPKSIKIGKDKISDVHDTCDQSECSVRDIFVKSSNVGTINMVREIGSNLQQIYLGQLGFFDRVNLNIPELSTPKSPDPWSDVSTDSISYGYGLSISPLHLILATATVLNGGYLIEPTFLKSVDKNKKDHIKVFSEETSENMRFLFSQVVADGTAKEAFFTSGNKHIIGGKTGTARTFQAGKYSKDHKLTSFISAFPIHKPEYILLTVFDRPYCSLDGPCYAYASWNAAKVARLTIDRISPILAINSQYKLKNNNLLINTSSQ